MSDDILIPKERKDAVVIAGIDKEGRVSFVKVYGISEEVVLETLERYMNAEEVHPGDFVLVSRGYENTRGKTAISVSTEKKLRLALAKLGLRTISNGILYLEDVERLYQITLVREELYSKVAKNKSKKSVLFIETLEGIVNFFISHGLSVLVENRAGFPLEDITPKGIEILYEPSLEEVARRLRLGSLFVVETKDADKYRDIEIPIVLKVPPLSRKLFREFLEKNLKKKVPKILIQAIPEEKLTIRNAKMIARIYTLLVNSGMEEDNALKTAISLNVGYHLRGGATTFEDARR